jgi:hypothetical protein
MDSEQMAIPLKPSIETIACPRDCVNRQTGSHGTQQVRFWDGISADACRKFSMTKW